MFKANGRTHREVVNVAKASVKNKVFVCNDCGATAITTNVEFGEAMICKCGKEMTEKTQE